MPQQRIYRPQFQHVVNLLDEVFNKGNIADKILPVYLKKHKGIGGKDRRFISACFYETVRFYYRYKAILERLQLQTSLEHIVGMYLLERDFNMPPFDDLQALPKQYPTGIADNLSPADYNSFPSYIATKLVNAHGAKILDDLNKPSAVYIRVYGHNDVLDTNIAALKQEGFLLQPTDYPKAFLVENPQKLSQSQAYANGLFEIQDIGSQAIGAFCALKSGDVFIDVCAGAGGKTLQLADIYGDDVKFVASDINTWKLDNLKFRATRAQIKVPEVLGVDKLLAKYTQNASFVLIDAPCTGIGVVGRKADSKYRVTENVLKETCKLQSDVLADYSKLLKPGGTLVYATCSILPEENELQVQRFLKENPSFQLMAQQLLLPSTEKGDGFYMAKLIST